MGVTLYIYIIIPTSSYLCNANRLQYDLSCGTVSLCLFNDHERTFRYPTFEDFPADLATLSLNAHFTALIPCTLLPFGAYPLPLDLSFISRVHPGLTFLAKQYNMFWAR